MNGDSLEIMKAISDARAEMLKAVGDLHQEFSGFKGTTEAKVQAAEARVKDLESDAKSDRFWSRVQTVCVIPIVGGLHQIASHFGWIK